jgi:HEAT repeat protein
MRSILRVFVLAATFTTALTGIVCAQQPQVSNAQMSSQQVDHGLQSALDGLKQSATPLWAGYSIPTASSFQSGWGGSPIAYLEKHGSSDDGAGSKATTGQDHAIILFRLVAGKIDQVRAEAVDRQLDGGGLRFVWLTNVTPEDSVATLKTLCLAADSTHLINSAVFLISIHQSAAAVPALTALAAPGPNPHLREQAAFWLANHSGHEGFVAIQNLARTDKDEQFRAKLTFDLTLSKDPGATPELVRMAHDDSSPHVRSQAQFWMASRGGKIVAASLRDSADNDPDASIRKKAVFAISRLPEGEAATQLVQLAESSKYPEVRKQAVFWLGQSKDPKALDYLTKLITAPSR